MSSLADRIKISSLANVTQVKSAVCGDGSGSGSGSGVADIYKYVSMKQWNYYHNRNRIRLLNQISIHCLFSIFNIKFKGWHMVPLNSSIMRWGFSI